MKIVYLLALSFILVCRIQSEIPEMDDDSFGKLRKSGAPILLIYSKESCPHCRNVAPVMEELQ